MYEYRKSENVNALMEMAYFSRFPWYRSLLLNLQSLITVLELRFLILDFCF
ncbi:MAG: hypothetical protein PWQ27_1409 [Kosmotoga sp.]|nr:hypothetical protein [Kosmotoga sp.]